MQPGSPPPSSRPANDLVACLDLRVALKVQAQCLGTSACFGQPGMLGVRHCGCFVGAEAHPCQPVVTSNSSTARLLHLVRCWLTCSSVALLRVVSQALHCRHGM